MIKQQLHVTNPSGIHARPASLLTETLKKFSCEATVIYKGKRKNGKSTIGLLSLGIKRNDTIELLLDGSDEKEALEQVLSLFEANFYEGDTAE